MHVFTILHVLLHKAQRLLLLDEIVSISAVPLPREHRLDIGLYDGRREGQLAVDHCEFALGILLDGSLLFRRFLVFQMLWQLQPLSPRQLRPEVQWQQRLSLTLILFAHFLLSTNHSIGQQTQRHQ